MDFVSGDEVYGNCTQLRHALETAGQAYWGRRRWSELATHPGRRDAPDLRRGRPAAGQRGRRVGGPLSRGTGPRGSGGMPGRRSAPDRRGTACSSAATCAPANWPFTTASCPKGQPAGMARLIRAAGLRWPVEEGFEFAKDCFGLDQSQVRLYHAIARHTVLADGRAGDLRGHRRPGPGSAPAPWPPASGQARKAASRPARP